MISMGCDKGFIDPAVWPTQAAIAPSTNCLEYMHFITLSRRCSECDPTITLTVLFTFDKDKELQVKHSSNIHC